MNIKTYERKKYRKKTYERTKIKQTNAYEQKS